MPELELLPEKTKKIDFGAKKSFGPGFLILALILAIYGGFLFYNRTLETKIQKLDADLSSFNGGRDKKEEQRISEVKAKLDQSQVLLGEHVLWSSGFKKIQQITMPSIQLESLVASLPELKFEFKAVAPNLTSIAKQAANFLADESVSDISVNQIKVLTSGKNEFVIKISFDREKFLK